jgi:hypothetical protein
LNSLEKSGLFFVVKTLCHSGTFYKFRQKHIIPCAWGEADVPKHSGNLREDHDFKQDTVASFLNIDRSTYSKYENGILEIPIPTLIQLAEC